MKTIAIIRRAVLMFVCGMLTVLGGCAGAPSMDTVSPAEIAVNRAIEARPGSTHRSSCVRRRKTSMPRDRQ